MVMERAARMVADADDSPENGDALQRGMRTAASFLNGEAIDLMSYLKEQAADEQMEVRSGMVRTLLRNIVLPREDTISERSLSSLSAMQILAGNAAEISAICSEHKQILEQYSQHRTQVLQQLDDAIRNQLKQKLLEQGQPIDDDMSLNPAMHPQYQEEVARMSGDLNDQYSEAIEQRKEAIRIRLGG